MSCVYCKDLKKYDLFPAERVITNARGVWDKDNREGPKPVMGHKTKHPISAVPGFFVLCEEIDP